MNKLNNNILKNNGFTLAEVLITLVIIGIIAALTFPTLIKQKNDRKTVAKVKKAYSALAPATNRIMAEEGTPMGDAGGWASSPDALFQQYNKHLISAKVCDKTQGCLAEGSYLELSGATGKTPNNWSYG